MDERRTGTASLEIRALGAAVALLAVLLFSCGGGAPDPDPGPNPDPTQDRVDFTGTVRDAGGLLVADAAVLLGQNPTQTNALGQFRYDGLLPGAYTLSLQDAAGNFDCREVNVTAGMASMQFTLPNPDGGTSVASVDPPLNAGGVSLDSWVRLTFSRDIDLNSVDAAEFDITPDIGSLAVTNAGPGQPPLADDSVAALWLKPELQLPADQIIMIELTGEILDAAGARLAQPLRWRFRTSAVDNSPPRLVRTVPASGATNHPPNSPVRFEYSEPIAVPDGDLVVSIEPAAEFSAYASGRSLIVNATGGWEIKTSYSISVANVADLGGNRDAADEASIDFTTGEQSSPLNHRDPEWNRANDLIVFAADPAGSYDIFSIKPDGSELMQQTMLPGDERQPTLSSDGRLLAFQHRDSGGKWSIMVMDLGGADTVQITPDTANDTQPQFSRTISDRIVFVSDRSKPVGLYLMNSDGSNPVEQDRDFNTAQTDPALHPLLDTQMLFTGGGGSDRDIWRKSVSAIDGAAINQNFTNYVLAAEHSPAWGPDAGFIVYISDYAGVDNLWYAEATGELAVQLTVFELPVLDVSVAPAAGDARAVLSVADDGGGSQLVIVDLITGGLLASITGEEGGN